jgi:hypothetical protein
LYSKNYYRVDCTSKHVTRAPKQLPSVSPTTVIPTAAPSITGAVTSLSIMSINGVLKNLHINEINQIRKVIIDAFIIKSNDVTMNIKYHSVILLKVNIKINDVKFGEKIDKKMVSDAQDNKLKAYCAVVKLNRIVNKKDYTLIENLCDYSNNKKLLINQFTPTRVENSCV